MEILFTSIACSLMILFVGTTCGYSQQQQSQQQFWPRYYADNDGQQAAEQAARQQAEANEGDRFASRFQNAAQHADAQQAAGRYDHDASLLAASERTSAAAEQASGAYNRSAGYAWQQGSQFGQQASAEKQQDNPRQLWATRFLYPPDRNNNYYNGQQQQQVVVPQRVAYQQPQRQQQQYYAQRPPLAAAGPVVIADNGAIYNNRPAALGVQEYQSLPLRVAQPVQAARGRPYQAQGYGQYVW